MADRKRVRLRLAETTRKVRVWEAWVVVRKTAPAVWEFVCHNDPGSYLSPAFEAVRVEIREVLK